MPPPEQADGGLAGGQRTHDDRRSAGLDGVRGLSALSIFVFHVWLYGRTPGPLSTGDIWALQLRVCVVAFFVLSGYLLYRSFARAARRHRGVDVPLYYKRRIYRIFPAYFVCMPIVYLLLTTAKDTRGVRLPDDGHLWLFAIMGQNYSSETILKINSVTWTLGVEVAFYAVLPLLGLFALKLAGGRWLPQIGLAVLIVAIGMLWMAWVFDEGRSQLYSKALPAYAPYFAFGMLGALFTEWRAEQGRKWLSWGETLAITLAGIGLVIANGYWHAHSGGPRTDQWIAILGDLPAGVGFMLITVAAGTGVGRVIGWTRLRAVAFVGVISYGFYLWHVPVILYLRHLGIEDVNPLFLLAAALPIALGLGTASWYLIERPLIARAHRRTLLRRERASDGARPAEQTAR